jgi:ABC-type branched-subunit amino acid transport system ATPase component
VLVIDKYVEKLIELADHHTIIERGQVVWQGAQRRWTPTMPFGTAIWDSESQITQSSSGSIS